MKLFIFDKKISQETVGKNPNESEARDLRDSLWPRQCGNAAS